MMEGGKVGENISRCPVCGSTDQVTVFPRYEGPVVTSDHGILDRAGLDNRCCKKCGLIFNAEGTRNFSKEFYRKSYRLMLTSDSAEIRSFTSGSNVTQSQRTFDLFEELVGPQDKGEILEAGAGKGDFLTIFHSEFPSWSITALEPSESYRILQERLHGSRIVHSDYTSWDIDQNRYDLIVTLGVLEHVNDPLDMFNWVRRGLKDKGRFFLRVPNFANNPHDLLCADHLSKLTVHTLESLAHASGFAVEHVREAGVPVFMVLSKSGEGGNDIPGAYEKNIPIAKKNADFINACLEAMLKARNISKEKSENFAIFGLASAGMFVPYYASFGPEEITAYIDENSSMWGRAVNGRPVGGLDLIKDMDIRHVALSISPVYFDQVITKLEPYGVSVYVPQGPGK